ncbi:MAG: hypothetical protein DMF68_19320 [Acidobacteria bacterium]|nr:MAG: hypothetical protein DMF68_19320 [Acidobacteriota bacterium]
MARLSRRILYGRKRTLERARGLRLKPPAVGTSNTKNQRGVCSYGSPDRKIYQRFRVESDRLVVTVSSRGVVPSQFNAQKSENNNGDDANDNGKERRGWGLKLIRSLMDEVEFERVDDGTCLRMTKYLRKS